LNFKGSNEIVDELIDYLQSDGSQQFKNLLSEDELNVIERVYFIDRGYEIT